jgi:molybdopterin-synthase adenylyltransferase
MMKLNVDKRIFERQIPIIGQKGQIKLKKSSVTIAGVGGLGSVVATYLVRAGVGNLKLIDHGRVEYSNLNRQILYSSQNISSMKSVISAAELANFKTNIHPVMEKITKDNVELLLENSDIIVDCLDNNKSRQIICKYAINNNIPLVYGAVGGLMGYITTIYKSSACPWCVFESESNDDNSIIGPTCGIIGSMQALETIRIIIGKRPLQNRLLYWNGNMMNMREIELEKNKKCKICGKTINKERGKIENG